jgi:predicted ester cyclase
MPHDNKALIRRWFDEVWNKRSKSAIYELAHPDVVTYGLGENGGPGGIDQFIPFRDRFIATFPDLHIGVEDVIAEGDKTAARILATGTHKGGDMGVAPTGKKVTVTGLVLVRWKDGKIIEGWNEFDAYGMMQQLAAPSAATGGQTMKIKQ